MVSGTGLRHIDGVHVETLELAYTPINDASLRGLMNWPKLRKLSLEHSSLTDSGLEHLTGLVLLDELHLPWVAQRTSNISAKAARDIERAIPNTKISYP